MSKIQKQITDTWSKDSQGNNWIYQDGEEKYNLQFNVNVVAGSSELSNEKNRNYNGVNNYIEIREGDDYSEPRSNIRNFHKGMWRRNTKGAGHEFGHIIGLKDHYKVKDDKSIVIDAGYESNLMSTLGAKIEQKNINDFMLNVLNNLIFSNNVFEYNVVYINVNNREK